MIDADINVSPDWFGGASTDIYSYFYQTYLQLIGTSLGLGRMGPYTVSPIYGVNNYYTNDTWQWSVMSGNSQDNFGGATFDFVVTPQMADIYAAQHDGDYPPSIDAMLTNTTGDQKWAGPYLEKGKVPLDPWSNPIQYQYPGTHQGAGGDRPDIWSMGPDKQSNTADDVANWTTTK